MLGQPGGDPMRTLKKLFTTEELLRLPTNDRRLELVNGKLYEMPLSGAKHGAAATQIGIKID